MTKKIINTRTCLKCREPFDNLDIVMDYRICKKCREQNRSVLISNNFANNSTTGRWVQPKK